MYINQYLINVWKIALVSFFNLYHCMPVINLHIINMHVFAEGRDNNYYIFCSDALMKKEPELIDIYQMFEGYEAQYFLVGEGLNVTVRDIIYNPHMPREALSMVFQRWKDKNKEVTWDRVIEVCKTFSELGKVHSNIKHFLLSQKAYDRYFEKPDRK